MTHIPGDSEWPYSAHISFFPKFNDHNATLVFDGFADIIIKE